MFPFCLGVAMFFNIKCSLWDIFLVSACSNVLTTPFHLGAFFTTFWNRKAWSLSTFINEKLHKKTKKRKNVIMWSKSTSHLLNPPTQWLCKSLKHFYFPLVTTSKSPKRSSLEMQGHPSISLWWYWSVLLLQKKMKQVQVFKRTWNES